MVKKGVMVFMNVLNIEHVSKIFGDKRFLMIFPMEFMMGIKRNHWNQWNRKKYSAENHCRGRGDR